MKDFDLIIPLLATILTGRLDDNKHFRNSLLQSLSDEILKALWRVWFKGTKSCFEIRADVANEMLRRGFCLDGSE